MSTLPSGDRRRLVLQNPTQVLLSLDPRTTICFKLTTFHTNSLVAIYDGGYESLARVG